MNEWKPFIRFDDQSENFTLGFEAGMIYQKLEDNQEFTQLIHTKNLSQINQIASKLGFVVEQKNEYLDEWVELNFTKKSLKRIK